MKSEHTVQQHIDILHQKVKEYKLQGLTDESIIESLKQDGVDAFYAQTILENIEADKDEKKGFWKLLIVGILVSAVAVFLHFTPEFDGRRFTLIYLFIFWSCIVISITMLYRAFAFFKK